MIGSERGGISLETIALILVLLFAILILWFYSDFILKFISVVGQAAITMVCGLLNFFITLVGQGLIPPVCV